MTSDGHGNDPRFLEYYALESATDRALQRALGIMNVILRIRGEAGSRVVDLSVADIGCNAGTQSRCWLSRGHRVAGLDISTDLIALARERNADFAGRASFETGSATRLPWQTASFDICLLPELLEHVEDWRSCLREAVRVLRPGGTLFLSTTNVLCPIQQEFSLPLFSWYPSWLKRHLVRLALTTHRHWVNFATYPAVNWFSPYGLSAFLRRLSVIPLDRFDLIDTAGRGSAARALIAALRAIPLLRLAGHIATPGTTLIGTRTA